MVGGDARAVLAEALGDRYALERELGQGGMATVYLARDLARSERVAIKVMDPHLADALDRKRFRREMESQGQKSKLLDRKFQEGLKKAKDDPDRPIRPIDID